MWVRLSRFQRTGRNFWSRNIVMRLGFLTTILWDNIQRMKQRGKPCITWWLCKNSRIQMSQTQTKAMGPHYFRPSIFKKLLFRIQRGESFLFWSIYPMPLCSQPFFLKRFSRAPFFFGGGITHAQTVWVLRKPSGFSGNITMPFFGPFVGSTFRIMWCSTMTFQRSAMIQKSCSWRTWRNANWWFEQQPKKSVKTNKPLAGVWKKHKKALVLPFFFV